MIKSFFTILFLVMAATLMAAPSKMIINNPVGVDYNLGSGVVNYNTTGNVNFSGPIASKSTTTASHPCPTLSIIPTQGTGVANALVQGDCFISSSNGHQYVWNGSGFTDTTGDLFNIPVGQVGSFATTSCPAGWIYADGGSRLKTNYVSLFSAMGSIHGNGSTASSGAVNDSGCPHASNCFNIPDYRGRFLRGHDDGSARDPDRAARTAMNTGGATADNVGSVQLFALQGHNHSINAGAGGSSPAAPLVTGSAGYNYNWSTLAMTNLSGYGTVMVSTETRPLNAYVKYCIKI